MTRQVSDRTRAQCHRVYGLSDRDVLASLDKLYREYLLSISSNYVTSPLMRARLMDINYIIHTERKYNKIFKIKIFIIREKCLNFNESTVLSLVQ